MSEQIHQHSLPREPEKIIGIDAEYLSGRRFAYQEDASLLEDVDLMAATPGADLNWLEDVHLGYEEGRAAIFDRNVNGWVTVPKGMKLPDNQQDRDMIARELLIKFQMSPRHPLVELNNAYRKF